MYSVLPPLLIYLASLDLRDVSVYRPTTGARSRTNARFRIRKRPPILGPRAPSRHRCHLHGASGALSAFDTHPHPLHSTGRFGVRAAASHAAAGTLTLAELRCRPRL